jgi:hypothetical protein
VHPPRDAILAFAGSAAAAAAAFLLERRSGHR